MTYIDTFRETKDLLTPGTSACKGCGGEMLLRRVLKIAGENSIAVVPPGCMAGAGSVGWDTLSGMRIPVTMTLLDNTASFLTGVSKIYERRGRADVNIIGFAGDGATSDCGFQSLSGSAERGDKMLYICYDNEGYMNTGYQRSSTTSLGSRTSTTPVGKVVKGKTQHQKYIPLIMMMHNAEYVATASPSNMADFTKKIEKGLAASKRGFAYIHLFAPCPTGWGYASNMSIEIAKNAVKSNFFPIFEYEKGKLTLRDNKKPIPVAEFIKGIKKFKHLNEDTIEELQNIVDYRMNMIRKLAVD
ncbi:thiamine pyrophosphate-dependent enzyme [Sedimentibacter sp.]|uniref:thiamine pyrophosphate-dependent enzyme n=1 Tax=Sedimentibacter sp. TaxID=1960295 RepID=UPI00289E604D|nr:thiamine pyrophosphate-dependent enzyme [Sedimentibacter sp.]